MIRSVVVNNVEIIEPEPNRGRDILAEVILHKRLELAPSTRDSNATRPAVVIAHPERILWRCDIREGQRASGVEAKMERGRRRANNEGANEQSG